MIPIAATTAEARGPIRCGSPRTPVRWSSSEVGQHVGEMHGGAERGARDPAPRGARREDRQGQSVASDGKIPKLTRNGTIEKGVAFSPALYAHAEARKTAWAASIPNPSGAASTQGDRERLRPRIPTRAAR